MKMVRIVALILSALMILLGVIALAIPGRVWPLAQFTTTPSGIYVAAGIRLAIGLILVLAASASRFPIVLRVLGVLVLLAGIATLAMGVQGARTLADALTNYGTTAVRFFGLFVLVVGSFIAFAVSTKSHPAIQSRS